MSSKELVDLNQQELLFVETLIENGGKLREAAEVANYHPGYVYKLRDRLSKAITQAAQEYLAMNSLKAAKRLVDSIDEQMPNMANITAAQALLDRVGIIKKDPNADGGTTIKANIFILPEKQYQKVIDIDATS